MKVFILFFTLLLSSMAWSNIHDLKPSGSGQLTWLFLDIYQATLYTSDGQYRDDDYPKALEITYQRDISAHDLIQTTADEWRRLNIPFSQAWLTQLDQIWPDVSRGDRLLLRADSSNDAVFYFNDSPIGKIEGTPFAEAFLAIWLSPNTRDKSLRAQLIGDNNA